MLMIYLFKLLTILTLLALITNGQQVDQNAATTTFRRLHQRKCREYQQYVYRYVFKIGLAIGEDPKKVQVDQCGHNSVPLIVGVKDAKLGEFPHIAFIGYERQIHPNDVVSTGSLISERFVLTAAHCLHNVFGKPSFVRLGEFDIAKSNPYTQRIPIEQLIPHFLFSRPESYHDIGLLKLSRDASLNSHVIPACLPLSLEEPESRYIATGLSIIKSGIDTSSGHLQKLNLDKYSNEECKSIHYFIAKSSQRGGTKFRNGIWFNNQFCAGSRAKVQDVCDGCSPLQFYHPDEYCMYIVAGVASFGYKCGIEAVPNVYTRVADYVDWIEQIIWPGEN